jgi:hypothetical protein
MVSFVLLLRQKLRDFFHNARDMPAFYTFKMLSFDKRAVPISGMRIGRLSHLWETARAGNGVNES